MCAVQNAVVCDDADQEALLTASLCMSYNDTIDETVAVPHEIIPEMSWLLY